MGKATIQEHLRPFWNVWWRSWSQKAFVQAYAISCLELGVRWSAISLLLASKKGKETSSDYCAASCNTATVPASHHFHVPVPYWVRQAFARHSCWTRMQRLAIWAIQCYLARCCSSCLGTLWCLNIWLMVFAWNFLGFHSNLWAMNMLMDAVTIRTFGVTHAKNDFARPGKHMFYFSLGFALEHARINMFYVLWPCPVLNQKNLSRRHISARFNARPICCFLRQCNVSTYNYLLLSCLTGLAQQAACVLWI